MPPYPETVEYNLISVEEDVLSNLATSPTPFTWRFLAGVDIPIPNLSFVSSQTRSEAHQKEPQLLY